jgi:hypothetical protein
MANMLPGDSFWDADQKLKPNINLENGEAGQLFHLGRGPTVNPNPKLEGATAVGTVYLPPGKIVDMFKGMGRLPNRQEFKTFAGGAGWKEGADYRFLPYELPTGVQAADRNPPVSDGRAMWNGLVRGGTNLLFGYESGQIRDTMVDSQVTKAAYDKGGAGDRVMDLTAALTEAGREDLIGMTEADLLAMAPTIKRKGIPPGLMPAEERRVMGHLYKNHEYEEKDREDPTFLADREALRAAIAKVDAQKKFNERTEQERRAIQQLEGVFTRPPITLGGGHVSGDPRLDNPDSFQMAKWVKSMTPEQRAATTPEMVTAKGKEIRTARRAKEIVDAFTAKAKTERFLNDYRGTSKASKLYSEDDSGYGRVWDEMGIGAVGVLLAEQGLESAPSTVATMAATAVAGALTGGSAVAGAVAMGSSTTAMGMGGNFTSAFGKWITEQDREIELDQLGDPDSQSFKRLLALAEKDPVAFMSQMDQMTAEGDKRAIIEGITAVALNKLGDMGMDKIDDIAPKGLFKEGSPLWAMRGTIRRPKQLADGFFWRKSLGPKLANAAKNTGWEAVEEGLTEIITSIASGEEVDMKTALSSFLVGGMMGGTSNFVAGVQNVDDPMALLREKVLNNEVGVDEVAKQIARNTGMPVKNAKAALVRAHEVMKHFDELKKKHPPFDWPRLRTEFLKGMADSAGTLKNYDADRQQIYMADARAARAALEEELKINRLEAFRPGKVKPDPRIKGIGDYLMIQNSNPAPGYDPARYNPPGPTSP